MICSIGAWYGRAAAGRGAPNPRGGPRSEPGPPQIARDIRLGQGKSEGEAALGADVFNLTNRVNYGSFVGTIGSPLFLQPTSARPARQVQLSARFKFQSRRQVDPLHATRRFA